MFKIGDEIHETGDEAREGSNVKGVTTVLIVSIALVVALFVAVYFIWGR